MFNILGQYVIYAIALVIQNQLPFCVVKNLLTHIRFIRYFDFYNYQLSSLQCMFKTVLTHTSCLMKQNWNWFVLALYLLYFFLNNFL